MRTIRVELEGSTGRVAIERQRGSATVRIDTVIRNPSVGQEAWKTWEIPARTGNDELFQIAEGIHQRVEGHAGTNSDVHGYLCELQRFID